MEALRASVAAAKTRKPEAAEKPKAAARPRKAAAPKKS
jgi:hypothetical protein